MQSAVLPLPPIQCAPFHPSSMPPFTHPVCPSHPSSVPPSTIQCPLPHNQCAPPTHQCFTQKILLEIMNSFTKMVLSAVSEIGLCAPFHPFSVPFSTYPVPLQPIQCVPFHPSSVPPSIHQCFIRKIQQWKLHEQPPPAGSPLFLFSSPVNLQMQTGIWSCMEVWLLL